MTKNTELYHRHPWVTDTRLVSEWHQANNETHPHPQESDIDYKYKGGK